MTHVGYVKTGMLVGYNGFINDLIDQIDYVKHVSVNPLMTMTGNQAAELLLCHVHADGF